MPLIFCPSDDSCTTWLFGNYAPNKETQKGQYASAIWPLMLTLWPPWLPVQNSQPQAMCLPPHPRWIQSVDAWLQHHACAGDRLAKSSMVQENFAALQPSHLVWVSPSTRLEVVRYWPQLPQDPRLVSKKTSLWQMEKVGKCWKSAHDQPISTVHVGVPLLPRIEWVSYLGIIPGLYLLKRSYQLQSLLLSTLEPHWSRWKISGNKCLTRENRQESRGYRVKETLKVKKLKGPLHQRHGNTNSMAPRAQGIPKPTNRPAAQQYGSRYVHQIEVPRARNRWKHRFKEASIASDWDLWVEGVKLSMAPLLCLSRPQRLKFSRVNVCQKFCSHRQSQHFRGSLTCLNHSTAIVKQISRSMIRLWQILNRMLCKNVPSIFKIEQADMLVMKVSSNIQYQEHRTTQRCSQRSVLAAWQQKANMKTSRRLRLALVHPGCLPTFQHLCLCSLQKQIELYPLCTGASI